MKAEYLATPKLIQILALLQQLPGNSLQIPLVLGPDGAGKTTLLNRLLQQPQPNWLMAEIQGSPLVNRDLILRTLSLSWIPGSHNIDDRALLYHLKGMAKVGQQPLLLVDDAELLPVEILSSLLQARLDAKRSPLYFPIVFANRTIEPTLPLLSQAGGQPLSFHLIYLPPWNREEIAVCYRGLHGSLPTELYLDRIYMQSAGLPGRLMGLLRQQEVPLRRPLPLLLGLGLAIGVAATAALLQMLPPQTLNPQTPKLATPARAAPLPIPTPNNQEHVVRLALPAQEQKPEAAPPATTSEPPPIPWNNETWLRTQPANQFTLQVATLPTLSELQWFAHKHQLASEGELARFAHLKDGQTWYTLVIGRYQDRRSAMKGRLLLPDSIDPEQVEPISFGSIQNRALSDPIQPVPAL